MYTIQTSDISRRRFLTLAGVAAASVAAPRRLFAAEQSIVEKMRADAATAKITVEKLRRGISALIGSGGNIAVLPGNDGKLLVDAGITGSRPKIKDSIAKLSEDPIRHLINTHWHFDHTDGNEWLHAAGATITAHTNTRKHLVTTTRVEAWNFTFRPSPAGALPTELVETDKRLKLNGTDIAIKYYGPAHTDGDLSVYFTDADVLHTGDTWWNGHYPFIDYSTGGSVDGMIRAAAANVAKARKNTIVIPGHGPVGDRSQLIEFRDVLATTREKAAALKREGKSLAEVIAAKPTKKFDAKWGGFVIKPDVFVSLVYAGV
jgi:glyoxylase-like metal-dependent hydrolase (beta-lactamase superfamily II)